MTITTSAVEARKNLGRFLNLVLLNGDDVVIERDGKPVARLGPIPSTAHSASGRLDFRKVRGLGADMWRGVDSRQYVNGERDAWD